MSTPATSPLWPLAALLHPADQRVHETLLEPLARALQAEGWRVGGLLARQSRYPNGHKRMQLVDLRTGALYDISQNLGAQANGCCLNPQGLSHASGVLRQALLDGVDLLLINRFGVSESEGRGFTAEFAQAVQAGVPVVTAVAESCLPQWQAFTGGDFETLPHHADALLHQCRARLQAQRAA